MNERSAIRPPQPGEAQLLSELAQRSKAHWDYDAEFLERIRPVLTLSEQELQSDTINVLVINGTPAGWYRISGAGPEGKLDDLWIDPPFIGGGNGSKLLRHALKTAASRGHQSLILDADPNAQGFYEAMGAVKIGMVSARSGRELPLMRIQTGL